MYSSARLDDSRSGLSSTTRSEPAMFACFARSSSVAVNPNVVTRFSSVTSASRPRVTPSFETSACSVASSRVLGAGKRPRPAAARRNGGLLALSELVEPIAEHLREQLILHDVAIAADRSLVARRPQVAEAHDGVRALLVGDDGVARAGMLGHVEDRPRPLRRRIGERREVLPDHRARRRCDRRRRPRSRPSDPDDTSRDRTASAVRAARSGSPPGSPIGDRSA